MRKIYSLLVITLVLTSCGEKKATSIADLVSTGNLKELTARVKAVIFKEGLKNTPLTVIFNVMEDAIAGTKITSSGTDINLHKPQNIRMLLEEGLRLGWTPEKKELILENGLAIYKKLGYKVEGI